jgi:hypothetical protein
MKNSTLQTLLYYLNRDALLGIPKYGVGWLVIALFIVMGLAQDQPFTIGIILFVGVLSSQKLIDHWRQRLECSTRTIVPYFSVVQNRTLLIWLGLFSVLVALLLVHREVAPLVAIALGLTSVWVSAWIILRYSYLYALPAMLWAITLMGIIVLGIVAPNRFDYSLQQGEVWAPVLLVIDALFVVAAVRQTQRRLVAKHRAVESDSRLQWKRVFGRRLGAWFSTLPLPPTYLGIPYFILVALAMEYSLKFLFATQAFGSLSSRSIVFLSLEVILFLGVIDVAKRFDWARATWSRQWLIPLSDGRTGFVRHLVTGLLREMSVMWLNVAVVFAIAAVVLLHRLPAFGYGAILAATISIVLGAASLQLLPAIWRYRGTVLVHGVIRIITFIVALFISLVVSFFVSPFAAWPWAVFSGSAVITTLSAGLLLLEIRGLAQSDFE